MLGKRLQFFGIVLCILLAAACSRGKNSPGTKESSTSSENSAKITENTSDAIVPEVSDGASFHIEKNLDFLDASVVLPYPENVQATPLLFTDTKKLIMQTRSQDCLSLLSMDVETKEFTLLKEMKKAPVWVSFVVHGHGENHLILEEYHPDTRMSFYYDLNMEDKTEHLICEVSDISDIHFTNTDYRDGLFALNLYNPKTNYYSTYIYSTKEHSLSLIEENNSAYPVFCYGNLYYILIDNDKGETSLIEYADGNKKELESIKDRERFLYGLYSNGKNLLKAVYNKGRTEIYGLDHRFLATKLYETESAEGLQYKNRWIAFLGSIRSEDRERLQYYLMDRDTKTDYFYEDGPVFLSEAGMVWVKFKKPENQIEKGGVFQSENSELRFFAFEKN